MYLIGAPGEVLFDTNATAGLDGGIHLIEPRAAVDDLALLHDPDNHAVGFTRVIRYRTIQRRHGGMAGIVSHEILSFRYGNRATSHQQPLQRYIRRPKTASEGGSV
jgi:hypothetical protein